MVCWIVDHFPGKFNIGEISAYLKANTLIGTSRTSSNTIQRLLKPGLELAKDDCGTKVENVDTYYDFQIQFLGFYLCIMFFLTDSSLFCIIGSKKKGLVFGTFGLG